MKNALIHVRFTLDIPEERLKAICKNYGLDPDNWVEYLDFMTKAEPEIEVSA